MPLLVLVLLLFRSIPDFSLIVGNPGKIIGWVNKQGEKLEFKSTGISNCGSYILLEDNTVKYIE